MSKLDNYKKQTFSPKKFDLSVLSIWIGYQINRIISNVQLSNFFSFLVLAPGKFLESLWTIIGTGSVFYHLFSFSNNVAPSKSRLKRLIVSVLRVRSENQEGRNTLRFPKNQYMYSKVLNKLATNYKLS